MMYNNLPIERADAQTYVPPVTQEIYVGTQRVICASETEKVGETNSECNTGG